jgi:hypothetical protein
VLWFKWDKAVSRELCTGPGQVAQTCSATGREYFGLSRAIYLQRKSYLYSHATHGTVRQYQHRVIWHCLCVANEESTWTRNPRLVPEKGEVLYYDTLTYSVWYYILVDLLCNARCMTRTIRTAVILLNQFSQCSKIVHSETLK